MQPGLLVTDGGFENDLNLALDQLDLSVTSLASSIEENIDFQATVYITLISSRGEATEATETISKATVDFDQTDLTFTWQADEFSNVDLSDVDFIELGFDGYDFVGVLESFSVNTVPEPSSATFLVSCLFFATIKRRRSR